MLAKDTKIATQVRSRLPALREHVELGRNAVVTWTVVARRVQNFLKTKQTIPLTVRSDADGNDPMPMQIGVIDGKRKSKSKDTRAKARAGAKAKTRASSRIERKAQERQRQR